jgi:hypothetical protein
VQGGGVKNLLAAIMTKTSGSALSAAVGGRIYFDEAPEGTVFPYVVFLVVTDYQDDTFKDKIEDVTIQFSLYSTSKGLTEITGMFANLKTLFDDAALTITANYHIMISRQNLTTMFDDITTPEGTMGLRHWAVDYRIITEAA